MHNCVYPGNWTKPQNHVLHIPQKPCFPQTLYFPHNSCSQSSKDTTLFDTAGPHCKCCSHVCTVYVLCICHSCPDVICNHSCQPVFTMQDIIKHTSSAHQSRKYSAIAHLVQSQSYHVCCLGRNCVARTLRPTLGGLNVRSHERL